MILIIMRIIYRIMINDDELIITILVRIMIINAEDNHDDKNN